MSSIMNTPLEFRTEQALYALGFRLEEFGVGSVRQKQSPAYILASAVGLEKLLDRLETAERESARRLGVCLRLEDAATQAADALRAAIDGPTQEIEPEPTIGDEFARMEREASKPEPSFEIGQCVRIIGGGPPSMNGDTGVVSALPSAVSQGRLYTIKLDDWGSACREAHDLESLGLCGVDSGGAPDSFCDKTEGHDGLHSDGCLGIAWPSEKAKAEVRKGQRTAPSLESRVNIMGQIVEPPPILCDAVIADPMRGIAHSCQLLQGHSGTHRALEFGDWR